MTAREAEALEAGLATLGREVVRRELVTVHLRSGMPRAFAEVAAWLDLRDLEERGVVPAG